MPSSRQSPFPSRPTSHGELGADVVIPEGANATQSIQMVRDVFGGGVDTAIHVAGDRSVVAGVVSPGGRFTSVTDTRRASARDAGYVPTIVTPSGHKLADLLFKVASHRLRSRVHRTPILRPAWRRPSRGEQQRWRSCCSRTLMGRVSVE